MSENAKRTARIRDVRRIFEEYGLGSVEQLDGWDGVELEELAEFLSEEEYQTLLDQLQEQDDSRMP